MKINSNSYSNTFIPSLKKGVTTTNRDNFSKDKIEISSKGSLTQSSFEAVLKKKLVNEIKLGVPESKVSEIKEQISLGKYQLDTLSISTKMLFLNDR